MKNVVIIPNPTKPEAMGYAMKLVKLLNGYDVQFIFPDTIPINKRNTNCSYLPVEEAFKLSFLAVTFGGDGSILHIAKHASQNRVPIIGVNLGTVGFLTELEPDELPLIQTFFQGNYEIDRRTMLDACVIRNEKTVFMANALNDAVISKALTFKSIRLEVCSDGQKMLGFVGDGVICCTPTGSTAYSMSAGGPIVDPASDNLIITPICAHAFYAKSFVLQSQRTITIRPDHQLEDKLAYLSIDGAHSYELIHGDEVKICRSENVVDLVRLKGMDFYKLLNIKLNR